MKPARWLPFLIAIFLIVAVVAVLWFEARPRAVPPAGPAASDWYEVYFTDPKYPDRPENRRGGIDERFVQFVDSAARSLDVAIYDFDLENVAQALARAHGRGVTVRLVTDSDTVNNTSDGAIQNALRIVTGAGIPVVPDGRNSIMHHKFAVRDGEEVWTGSWNMTTGDTYRLNNNAARIRSAELASQYTTEFETMFVQKRFGSGKAKTEAPPAVQIRGARVQALFSPDSGVADHLIARINQASRSVRFLAFSFTHDGIGQAILARAGAGARVDGVFETTGSNTRFSEYGTMKQAGLNVHQDGNPYVMHHKVIVLDGRTVIFGSYNFSESAERENDENCLIVDDPGLAAAFSQEVDRMLAVATSPTAVRVSPERERPR